MIALRLNSFGPIAFGLLMACSPVQVFAQESDPADHASPYAGFETREIKSLSEADIEELGRGGGWGLALAAELNGVPGPAHLLELASEIDLSAEQVATIEEIYAEMQSEAIALGGKLIAAEQALEAAFVAGDLRDQNLRALIENAEAVRADLRFVHLSRHLSTPPILSAEQIDAYRVLRGYGTDPCETVPEGHDAELWRQHNNCS